MSRYKTGFKSNNYWKRSWNLGSLLYFFISLFCMVLIILLTGFVKKQTEYKITWSNAITVGCVLILSMALLVIILKSGFGRSAIKPIIESYHNRKVLARAKSRYSLDMTQFEKDKILFNERKAYNEERDRKNLKKEDNKSTNLASYLLICISILVLSIGLVIIHYF